MAYNAAQQRGLNRNNAQPNSLPQPPPASAGLPAHPGLVAQGPQIQNMSAEQAAQFRDYGYGSTPQRGGGHHGRGRGGHRGQNQTHNPVIAPLMMPQQPQAQVAPGYPPAQPIQYGQTPQGAYSQPYQQGAPVAGAVVPLYHTNAQVMPQGVHQQPFPPVAYNSGPPAKRARYDNPMNTSPMPTGPQQMMYNTQPQQYIATAPAGTMPLHQQQQQYNQYAEQPQYMQQPYAMAGSGSAPIAYHDPHSQQHQPYANIGLVNGSNGHGAFSPQQFQPSSQPIHLASMSSMPAQPGAPIHLTAAGPVGHGHSPHPPQNRSKNNGHRNQNKPRPSSLPAPPHLPSNQPPPPAASTAPPPPPPPPGPAPAPPPNNADVSQQRPGSGSIRLAPQGAATLPPTPVASTSGAQISQSVPSRNNLPHGTYSDGTGGSAVMIRRDPALMAANASGRGGRSGSSGRGGYNDRDGGRGRGSSRGRGGRGGFNDRRGDRNSSGDYNSRNSSDRYETASNSSNTGHGRNTNRDGPFQKGGKRSAQNSMQSLSPVNQQHPNKRRAKGDAAAIANAYAEEHGNHRDPSNNTTRNQKGKEKEQNPSANTKDSQKKAQKKTLTDFRIEGLEIVELGWSWKALPNTIPENESLETEQPNLDLPLTRSEKVETDEESTDDSSDSESDDDEGEDDEDIVDKSSETSALEQIDEAEEVENNAEALDTDLDGIDISKPLETAATSVTMESKASVDSATTSSSTTVDASLTDRRKEKRKHSGSDDEDPDIHAVDGELEEKDSSHHGPLGKKARSLPQPANIEQEMPMVAPSIHDDVHDSALVETEHALPINAGNDTVASVQMEDVPNAEDVHVLPLATSAPANLAETPSDHLSVAIAGDAKVDLKEGVVPAIIEHEDTVEAPSATLHGFAHADQASTTADGTAHSSPKSDLAIPESAPELLRPPSQASRKSAKKEVDNSRLRLYFSHNVPKEPAVPIVAPAVAASSLRMQGQKRRRLQTPADEVPSEPVEIGAVEVQESKADVKADTAITGQAEVVEVHASDNAKTGEESVTEAKTETDDTVNALGSDAAEAEVVAAHTPSLSAVNYTEKFSEEAQFTSTDKTSLETPLAKPTQSTISSNEPSPDRLSISYAHNTHRLIIDASVIEELCVFRAEAKVEIKVRLSSYSTSPTTRCYNGIFLEAAIRSGNFVEVKQGQLEANWPKDATPAHPEQSTSGNSASMNAHASGHDPLLPPLHILSSALPELTAKAEDQNEEKPTQAPGEAEDIKPSLHEIPNDEPKLLSMTVIARLDRDHPLTEAKWVRTGSVDEWILSLSPHTSSPQFSSSAWKGKIKVSDPDPTPTFQHALESWVSTANSKNGFDHLRYQFTSSHFKDVRNVFEVLLRLIRLGSGSGASNVANTFSQQSATAALQATSLDAPYPDQQTPVSLATFQLLQMGVEAAVSAGLEQDDILRRVGSVIRSLPYSMIFKSLDSMFVDYKRAQPKNDHEQAKTKAGKDRKRVERDA